MRTPSIVVSVVVLCVPDDWWRCSAQRQAAKGSFARASPGCRILPDRLPRGISPGVWVGPIDNKPDPVPPMTPAGEALFKEQTLRGRQQERDLGASNDPFITCDPLGFPRNLLAHAVSSRGRFIFGSAPGPHAHHV